MTPDLVTPFGLQLFGVAQQLEGALVACAGADDAIEARHGLSVVVEHFGAGFDDDADGFVVALEVGDENFNAAAGGLAANFFNDHGEGARAADEVVVAIDAGDDGVLQAERGHGFGDAARLVEVDGLGTALGHGAESAAARAQVAEHHEGRGFVVPALADVGAVGALADGVQVERAGQALEVVVVFAHGGARLEPLRLGGGCAAQGEIWTSSITIYCSGTVGADLELAGGQFEGIRPDGLKLQLFSGAPMKASPD